MAVLHTSGTANGIYILGNYAYVAVGFNGLEIYNISDPSNPTFVGRCDTPGEAIDVIADGDYAYVADANSGLEIITISDTTDIRYLKNICYFLSSVGHLQKIVI